MQSNHWILDQFKTTCALHNAFIPNYKNKIAYLSYKHKVDGNNTFEDNDVL